MVTPPIPGLPQDRCVVMGVVNVTPDSFSDGGRWFDPGAAVEHGLDLVRRGADLVDVGGESTRPGALPVDRDEELRRVVPVVRRLADAGVVVSVDTMWAETARQSIEAGAAIVNDVSGGRADPQMVPLVADAEVPFVVMHWRAHSDRMQQHTDYDDVVEDVVGELREQYAAVCEAGVDPERVILDPGLGFSKTGDQNWTLLAHLDRFTDLGRPLLVAASRKGFLGALLADAVGPRPVDGREDATAALSTLAALSGAWGVRVHDPRPSADAVRVAARLRSEGRRG
ncbi:MULTISPECIES: dihydropteroate synthase [unclassified Aeromicrobium]|uniref:dihydropteroate synthase n=1 Tax=unclassified Aeromicrobium TaxID=2633570 RepID=UPI00396AF052